MTFLQRLIVFTLLNTILPGVRGQPNLTWTTTQTGVAGSGSRVIFGNGLFVAGFNTATQGGVLSTSSNGTSWTTRLAMGSAVSGSYSLAYGNGTFVATGRFGPSYASRDGVAWASGTNNPIGPIDALVYGAGKFVGIGNDLAASTSTDGLMWRPSFLLPQGLNFTGAAYNGSMFLATAYTNGIAAVQISTDGSLWRSGTAPNSTGPISRMTVGLGMFVAAGDDGKIYTTTDGKSWLNPYTASSSLAGITFGAGRFVAVGANGLIIESTNGFAWAPSASGTSTRLVAVAYGNGSFVITKNDTSGTVLVASDISDPKITADPLSPKVTSGERAVLAVQAVGTEPLTYQWRKNDVNIPGATNATYVLDNAQINDFGTFSVMISNAFGSIVSEPATLTVNYSRIDGFTVLSTLADAADRIIVAAVIGGGTESQVKKPFLVRAIGPSLDYYGVKNGMQDPFLRLYADGIVVASNDDWVAGERVAAVGAQVGALPLMTGSRDAEVLFDSDCRILPRSYSIEVSGVNGATGVVLAELYDATPSSEFWTSTPRLINISVLKRIAVDGTLEVMFGIKGNTARRLLVRAIGPALGAPPFNMTGVLADPEVAVIDFFGPFRASNDDWSTAEVGAVFKTVGAFALPPGSKDAGLLVSLEPGAHIVTVQGKPGTGGWCLVEIYEVP